MTTVSFIPGTNFQSSFYLLSQQHLTQLPVSILKHFSLVLQTIHLPNFLPTILDASSQSLTGGLFSTAWLLNFGALRLFLYSLTPRIIAPNLNDFIMTLKYVVISSLDHSLKLQTCRSNCLPKIYIADLLGIPKCPKPSF